MKFLLIFTGWHDKKKCKKKRLVKLDPSLNFQIIIFGIYNFEKIYKKLCCKASNDNVNQIDSAENEVFLPPDTMEMTPQSGAEINSAWLGTSRYEQSKFTDQSRFLSHS